MREIMGFIIQICVASLYMIHVTQAGSGVCTGDKCSDVVLMPLLNNDLTATLTANLDVSLMNKYLRDYIRQEIKQGIESAIKDIMEPMVDNKTEKAIENMKAVVHKKTTESKAEIDGKTAQIKVEIDAMVEKSKQAIVTIEAKFQDTKAETDKYISQKITDFGSIFERKDRQRYAFNAFLSSNKDNLPKGTVLVFDQVALNTGRSYNGATGIFTCQESGIYTFTWTTVSEAYKDFTSAFVVNGALIAENAVDNEEVKDWMTGSLTVVVHLSSGDGVWIQVTEGSHVQAVWNLAPCFQDSKFIDWSF